jgi:DNA-binding MarR family transcriptional regulator
MRRGDSLAADLPLEALVTDVPRHTTYSLLFDIFVLGQRVRELLAAAMATSPLRPEEYAIYSVVFEDESVSPTAMAAQLSMPLTTVVDAIRTMEGRGHVRRMPNPSDGRSYLVVLTGEGLRAHAEANARFEVGYRAFVAGLPDGEAVAQLEVAKLLAAAARAISSTAPAGSPRSG